MNTLLYNRSCYSLLSSCLTIDQLTDFAVANGYRAVGLIDRNVMYGAMEFFHSCTDKKLKPLYGLEISVSVNDNEYPFVLLCRNNRGFRELISISTDICINKTVYDKDRLNSISDNIYIIDVCYGGLLEKNINNCAEVLNWYKEKNIFIGLKPSKGIYDYQLNRQISDLAFNNGLTTVAMPLALYCDAEDYQAFNVMQQINNSSVISESNSKYGFNLLDLESYYRLYDEINRINTERIAEVCSVDLDTMEKASLPDYRTGEISDRKLYLREYSRLGLVKRFEGESVPGEYYRRLQYELDVITSMGFENYFLIVWDIIRYARRNNINVGIGRGSVAGSLVAYCLGITHIDPIKYGLIFERFLNPERITLPDIDIDIPDNKRTQVIEYVKDTYGRENVSNIIAFSTFAPKQVLRDVGSVLSVSEGTLNIILNCIPANYKGALQELYDSNDRFRQAVDSEEKTQKMYGIACRLEGLPKQVTTHAAGIIVSKQPLINYIPLIGYNDGYSSQYTMKYLEELGLIKIDFLGLRNLRIIDDILHDINENINILKIDLQDHPTYQMIAGGNTSGIFQLESEGMRNLIRQLKPDSFNEIVDIVALYRPGPMKFIPDYIEARKSGRINYIHPDLKDILQPTYGVMIYQEQVMQIAQRIAGFSYGKADILRKAISKKNERDIQALRNDFIAGANSNHYSIDTAEEIFRQIERFASYGFNKSHSVAYAYIAYQQAYLKAHYPLAFYKTMLNDVTGNKPKTNQFLAECRRNNVRFKAPDINVSEDTYIIDNDSIVAPLTIVKGLDRNTVRALVSERKHNGLFRDYIDFISRCYVLKINEEQIMLLILSGCCDSFKETRATMLANISIIITYAKTCYSELTGALDYSLASQPALQRYTELADRNKKQRQIIDIYINGHPVEAYRRRYPDAINAQTALKTRGHVALVVRSRKVSEHFLQESQTTMCFIDREDETGMISLALMPEVYSRNKGLIAKDTIYYVEGDIGTRDSVRVRRITKLD
ncbi:MAG: DNA polymerase III subunit alpha [Erysipelotrichaceae bacterium]|nr:DNA polymerase III subunit alpha [Erysipelotrichaceae bacterium]